MAEQLDLPDNAVFPLERRTLDERGANGQFLLMKAT